MMNLVNDSQSRLEVLREMLREGSVSTQEEICEALKRKKFTVTQSTVSRDLRRIGAVKTINPSGEIIYRLSEDQFTAPLSVSKGLHGLLISMDNSDSLIVVRTTPGSASLVARHLDAIKPEGILGTIAGDDTIFVAVAAVKYIPAAMRLIRAEFAPE
jgi:transcriptional regulator of arginine metabolism